jgi:hypothetical protein
MVTNATNIKNKNNHLSNLTITILIKLTFTSHLNTVNIKKTRNKGSGNPGPYLEQAAQV